MNRIDIAPTFVQGFAGGDGLRLTSTYKLKRRQKVIVRFLTAITDPDYGGNYAIKVSGDGISFDESKSPTNTNNSFGVDKTLSLPKSGKLRLVMDDGTVQEINLARVCKATVKP